MYVVMVTEEFELDDGSIDTISQEWSGLRHKTREAAEHEIENDVLPIYYPSVWIKGGLT